MHPDPDRLIHVSVFAPLGDEDRNRIASWLEVEEHKAGKHLTHDGTSDYGMFVLDAGDAVVQHDGREVARLGAGDVFGELAMLGDGHRRAEVIALTDVRVFWMFGTHFREMQDSMPSVAAALQELADRRIPELDPPKD